MNVSFIHRIGAVLIVMLFFPPVFAAVPVGERAALIAFYNSTDGDNWYDNAGWKTPPLDADGFAMPGTEDDWLGITVTDGHVTEILIMFNNLNGHLPPELGDLSRLKYLHLGDNYTLSGSLPPELGKLVDLESIHAPVNQLSGTIPPELGNLKKLKCLALYANNISGSLPPELGNIDRLECFMMGWNHLSGSIPPELGKLTEMEWLDLYANHLSGRIPPSLGNLTKLRYLGLYWNKLTGKIPDSLINLQSAEINISYNGLYTDNDILRAFLDEKNFGWENSQTTAPSNVSLAAVSDTSVRVSWLPILYSWDAGGYRVFYRPASGGAWSYAGMTADKANDSFTVTGLESGTGYCFAVQTRTDENDTNPNTVDSEYSEDVCGTAGGPAPFGCFDSPLDGSAVSGSIPVTGWALDDFAVAGVKIYRQAPSGTLVFIGAADFVEGARPDVEIAYPGYPNNSRAGWGYMMLTNFLPGGGNGTFTILALASDVEGSQTVLGRKTIVCNNADAVKPFGAIDTPQQGETASSGRYVNFGWVLTPPPNTIPRDGSTITVWVDGVPLGHPVYNRYRWDIAALFPGYNNSNGAVGYFYLDAAAYENGLHTIQWTAVDDAGNTDGIGSRYFTIQNMTASQSQSSGPPDRPNLQPLDYTKPVQVKTGYNEHIVPEILYPDGSGNITVQTRELQRLEIRLGDGNPGEAFPAAWYNGYMRVGNRLNPLPAGSTLDKERGIFYWQPGAGFVGEYMLIFVENGSNGCLARRSIVVKIEPGV